MNYSTKGGYDMIIGRHLLTELGIEADDGPFKGSTTPMVDLGTYIFKYSNTGKLHLNNCLLMLPSKKYINQNMRVMLQNNYL